MRARHFAFLPLKTITLATALLFLLAIATSFAYAQTYIFGRADFPTGATPISVVTGDLNGDGIVDLVTANSSDNTISVLLGKADGTFNPKVDYMTGTGPALVAIGDFNGDGNLDLAVANENCQVIDAFGMISCGAGTVSIFLGNGDGTFQSKVDYPTGNGPEAVVTNDFNGDGKLDLAIANLADATVSILKGNGDGTFQSQIAYATVSGPQTIQLGVSIVAADFNGDHILDLAVGIGAASILLGNGDGTFQKPLALNVPSENGPPLSMTAADFNSDGKMDLATSSGIVSIFLGNGDGTFTYEGYYSQFTVPAVVAGDFNGDGRPDLALPGIILLGNGDGTFQAGMLFGMTGFPEALAVADFNGDGKLDVGVAAVNGVAGENSVVSVVLGLGDGTFVGKTDYAIGATPLGVTTADLRAVGTLDLVINNRDGSVSVLLGNGNGTFSPGSTLATSQAASSVAVRDFNNDGKPDLATVNPNCTNVSCTPGSVSIFIGDGLGGFQATSGSYPVGVQPGGMAVDDFNKDGNLDLAVANNNNSLGNTVSVLLGNGDGTFQTPKDYTTALGPSGIATGDFDGDGVPDMAILTNDGGMSILLGNGDGTFKAHVDYPSAQAEGSIVVGDFNGDGKLDLAAGWVNAEQASEAVVNVFLGNGDGTFQPGVPYSAGAGAGGPVGLGDFNGDGKLDLVGVGSAVASFLLLGNGDGTLQPPIQYLMANQYLLSLAVGDFNGDGIPDWVAIDGNTDTAGVMLSIPFKAVSPTSLNFGSQGVSTTSLSKAILISNPSNVSFNIGSIAVSGDFQEANNCGASLQPGTNCTVNVTFSPATTGLESGTLTITDGTRSNPQGIPLSGTGVSGAFLTPSPGRLNFGAINAGTTSAAMTTTLVNTGNASLTLTGISIAGVDAGDFSVSSNNCGSSLNAGSSCAVSVKFTPTAGGARAGTVSISDNASNSPQTVVLSGTGITSSLGFGIAAGGFSSTIITAGQTASYMLTIGGQGIGGTVTLSCKGAPTGASCVVPASVTASATSASTFTVTVSTTTRSTAAITPNSSPIMGWLYGLAIFGMVLLPGSASRTHLHLRLIRVLPIALLLLLSSCGGGGSGSSSGTQSNPGNTPGGVYTLTVTATSGSTTQSVPLTLTVQIGG
jgi:FG-GAP-like repeat/Cep192 domain 4